MKVDVEAVSATQRRLHVEIPAEKVNETLQELYGTLRKEAKIPGFRPGRAPLALIKARFKDYIRQEAIQSLIPGAYEEALQAESFKPLGTPDMEPALDKIPVEDNQPIRFTLSMDIQPEIELPPYSEIQIDKGATDVPREAVDRVLERLQAERAEYPVIEEDRPAVMGDFLTLDWKVTEDEATLTTQADRHVKLEEGHLLPELEQALVDVSAGTVKEVPITFPEDHADTGLAGKSVVFHVTVKAITQQTLPELDDAFAAERGYETMDQMIGSTWNQLIEAEKNMQRQGQIQEILEQLREKTEIEIPETFLDQHVARVLEEYQRRYQREGRSLEDIETDEFRQGLRDEAVTALQNSWILQAIMEKEEIKVEDWEVDREIRALADQRNQDAETYRKMLESAGRLEQLEESIQETKVFDLLIENASVKESLIVSA